MQVVTGVYLVNGFPYGLHQNSYVIGAPDATIMVEWRLAHRRAGQRPEGARGHSLGREPQEMRRRANAP